MTQPPIDPGAEARRRFQRLLRKSNHNTEILSMSAPPLATSYVRSRHPARAHANKEGSLAEVIFPSLENIQHRITTRVGDAKLFAYDSTAASFAYPPGYGERSAQALQREENTYQLRGVFASAVLALTKLRARVEARGGDVGAINLLFAHVWGLPIDAVDSLPQLHLAGSEMTRIAATEDRAYHALSGHPAHVGGYRIDLATITPDALGPRTPINWPRIRTSLKAIAEMQLGGDIEWRKQLQELVAEVDLHVTWDLTSNSQAEYMRPQMWEKVMAFLITSEQQETSESLPSRLVDSIPVPKTYEDASLPDMSQFEDLQLQAKVLKIAEYAKAKATIDIKTTIDLLYVYDHERALMHEKLGEKFDDLDMSELVKSFDVPRYKVTRSSLFGGVTTENLGRDDLPDVRSHGPGRKVLNMPEFRHAGLLTPIDVCGALNMAVYIMVNKRTSAIACYQLLRYVKDPTPKTQGSVGHRLRCPTIFSSPEVRALGSQLLGEAFMSIFESIVANMTIRGTEQSSDAGLRDLIWSCLSGRSCPIRKCPVKGGWRDLIVSLWVEVEGWTLFYWIRMAMGKLQFAMTNSILAPIAAGDEVDFLTLLKKGIRVRAEMWSQRYTADALILAEEEKKRRKAKEKESDVAKYVPPHLRKRVDLDAQYDSDRVFNQKKGLGTETYQRIVEMQTKAKFFASIEISALDRKVAVGVSDEHLLQMFIEFYQARWYSLERRIEKAKEEGDVFVLGIVELREHPWGALVTEFPSTMYELMEMYESLNPVGWTIPPGYILEKLKKSISELWEDVVRELNLIRTYIEDVHDCLADEQTEALARSRVESVLGGMIGVPAITIPVPGYRAMHLLPEKTIAVHSRDLQATVAKQFGTHAFVSSEVTNRDIEQPDSLTIIEEEGEFGTFEDMDEPFMAFGQSAHITELEEYTIKHLTYRELWKELELPCVPDDAMKIAYGMSAEVSLDDEHLDSQLGPVIPVLDRGIAKRSWLSRIPAILRRMGHRVVIAHEDDMV